MRIRGTRTVLRAEQSDKRTSTRSARVPQSKKKLNEREWNGEGTYTYACNQLVQPRGLFLSDRNDSKARFFRLGLPSVVKLFYSEMTFKNKEKC